MEEINKKLRAVQGSLNVPKGQMNNFGGYKYRSCEDILESVKPLLSEYGLSLVIYDEIVSVGDRFYIKATAEVSDGVNKISSSALAREPENKKGMDEAQITGATSSYARKYALNGLFCIDDNKDPDSTNKQGKDFEVKDGCVSVTDIIRMGEKPNIPDLDKHGEVGTYLDYDFKANIIDNYVPRREDFKLPELSGKWLDMADNAIAGVSDQVAENGDFFDKIKEYVADEYIMDKTYKYRGEADLICKTDDGFFVLDIKKTLGLTKKKAQRELYLMQCVAYAQALGFGDCLGVVLLSPDAFIVECNMQPIWEQFLVRRGEFKGKFGL